MSNTFVIVKTESDLVHYGILGQKWGIRRFQNYDGTYTQRGLKRYNATKEQYDKAKSDLKAAKESGSQSGKRLAKAELKSAKRQLKKDYKQLKQDKLADEGKELYKSGKRITLNNELYGTVQMGTMLASYAANRAYSNSGKAIVTKYGLLEMDKVAPAAVAAGGTLVNAILYTKNERENKRLRAYYAH